VDLASVAPSLVIGVAGNADRADLGIAFALASRRLKTSSTAPFTIEQLTTALADLEENLKTPRLQLWYQVPANPQLVDTDPVIAVRGVRYDLKNVPSDLELLVAQDANAEDLARLVLAAAIKSLYAWKWEEAAELSRKCLKYSKVEDLRDEALNVLAATLLARGEAAKALAALRKAVEGEWGLALQTNLAVVASEADPATAIEHMSYLIAGVEDSEQRRQAALLAVALWKRSQGEEKESEDEDDFDPPPRSVLDAIYDLLDSSDLTEENFYDLGMFLARVDADQLNVIDLFENSSHSSSPSARLIRARANGYFEFVAEFGPIAKARDDHSRPWIMNAIEQYVRAVSQMIADGDNTERQKIAIMHGYKLFDTGMPMNSVARVLLLAVLILNFKTILPEDGAPKDVVDEWLTHAFQNVSREQFEMDGDQKESLLEAIAAAAYILVHFRHKEIIPTLRQADNQSLIIAQKTSGFFSSFTVDKSAVRGAARPIFDFCAESKRTYARLRPMLKDETARNSVDAMVKVLDEISARVSQWV
jgi:tetratricopeptide (TPR) repeat protein